MQMRAEIKRKSKGHNARDFIYFRRRKDVRLSRATHAQIALHSTKHNDATEFNSIQTAIDLRFWRQIGADRQRVANVARRACISPLVGLVSPQARRERLQRPTRDCNLRSRQVKRAPLSAREEVSKVKLEFEFEASRFWPLKACLLAPFATLCCVFSVQNSRFS